MGPIIAKYSEKRFDGKRQLLLYSDHIAITGETSLGPRFEQTLPLESLVPTPSRMWVRPNGFWSGVLMLVAFSVLPLGFESVLSSWWKGLFWVLATGGALLALATARRVEWVIFHNMAGTPALSIARSGSNRLDFQTFIEAVSAAIKEKCGAHGA